MAMPTNMGEWGNESESRVARRMEPAAFNAVCAFLAEEAESLACSHKM